MLLIHLFPFHSLRLSSAIYSTPVISADFNLLLQLALNSWLSISPPNMLLSPSPSLVTHLFCPPSSSSPFFDNLSPSFSPWLPMLRLSALSFCCFLPPSLSPSIIHPRVHLGLCCQLLAQSQSQSHAGAVSCNFTL